MEAKFIIVTMQEGNSQRNLTSSGITPGHSDLKTGKKEETDPQHDQNSRSTLKIPVGKRDTIRENALT